MKKYFDLDGQAMEIEKTYQSFIRPIITIKAEQ